MGSKNQYKPLDLDRVEGMIESTLIGVLRIFVVVFFVLVSALAFAFAVSMTGVCVAALGLRLMLRFVSARRETQRLFALAGC